jgi:two-component system, LytTR family, response regulator
MNCIVVDDNKMASTVLAQLIAKVDFLTLKGEFSNSLEAFNFLEKENVDLVFLDVEMPDMSGIELIKNLEKRPIIILVSAKKDYAVEGFELKVADYLLKPVSLPRFMTAVSRAKELFDQEHKTEPVTKARDYIFVRSNSVLTKIRITDIIYIQASGDYVNIFTKVKRYTVHITLRAIEEKLPSDKFYRLHRSYLVALDQVDAVEEGTAYLEKHPLPIGEQFKKDLLKKLNLI